MDKTPDPMEQIEALKPCPCGNTPTLLHITCEHERAKWAHCSGDCCNEWSIEYRNNYTPINTPEGMALAVAAWNDASRALAAQPGQGEPWGWVNVKNGVRTFFNVDPRQTHDNGGETFPVYATPPTPTPDEAGVRAKFEVRCEREGIPFLSPLARDMCFGHYLAGYRAALLGEGA